MNILKEVEKLLSEIKIPDFNKLLELSEIQINQLKEILNEENKKDIQPLIDKLEESNKLIKSNIEKLKQND